MFVRLFLLTFFFNIACANGSDLIRFLNVKIEYGRGLDYFLTGKDDGDVSVKYIEYEFLKNKKRGCLIGQLNLPSNVIDVFKIKSIGDCVVVDSCLHCEELYGADQYLFLTEVDIIFLRMGINIYEISAMSHFARWSASYVNLRMQGMLFFPYNDNIE